MKKNVGFSVLIRRLLFECEQFGGRENVPGVRFFSYSVGRKEGTKKKRRKKAMANKEIRQNRKKRENLLFSHIFRSAHLLMQNNMPL